VLLAGRDLGETHLNSGNEVSYPIRYSYQNRGAESARDIYVNLYLTATDGHDSVKSWVWHVR